MKRSRDPPKRCALLSLVAAGHASVWAPLESPHTDGAMWCDLSHDY